MSHSDPFEDFLSVSAALTGFSVAQLQGTGMARGYFDELVAIVGDELTLALTREGRLALRWPDDVEEQLRLRVMDDPDLGPPARNLAVLWYTGSWFQLPAVRRISPTGSSVGFLVTRFTTPPEPPRPKIMPAGPLRISTRSRL